MRETDHCDKMVSQVSDGSEDSFFNDDFDNHIPKSKNYQSKPPNDNATTSADANFDDSFDEDFDSMNFPAKAQQLDLSHDSFEDDFFKTDVNSKPSHKSIEDELQNELDQVTIGENNGEYDDFEENGSPPKQHNTSQTDDVSYATREVEDVKRLRDLLQGIVFNKVFSNDDFDETTAICFRANTDSPDCLAGHVLSDCLRRVMIAAPPTSTDALSDDIRNFEESVCTVFKFIAKVTVYCHALSCQMPLTVVCREIDGFNHSQRPFSRSRACSLIESVLCANIQFEEEAQAVDDEDLGSEAEVSNSKSNLPSSVLVQWAMNLCQRRLDKIDYVRAAAAAAIAQLPVAKYLDPKGKTHQPNDLLLGSLMDKSEMVRMTAARNISLFSDKLVDVALDVIAHDDKDEVRRFMAARLFSAVHLNSFLPRQRLKFLKLLFEDSHAPLRLLATNKLIPRWLQCAAADEHDDFLEDEGEDEAEERKAEPPFPFALLHYLNPLDDEETVAKAMMLCLWNYMESVVGNRNDSDGFLSYIRKIPGNKRRQRGIMHARSIEDEVECVDGELHLRLFFHRCLVELFVTLNRYDYGKREKVVSRLLPNMNEIVRITSKLCDTVLTSDKPNPNGEFCIRQLCLMIRLLDDGCHVGRKAYRELLYKIAGDIKLSPSVELVEFVVTELIDRVCEDLNEKQEAADALCYCANNVLDNLSPDEGLTSESQEFIGNSDEESEKWRLFRAGTILHAILRYPAYSCLTVLMKTAFLRVVDPLFRCGATAGRVLCCKLIGLASSLDRTTMEEHVASLRHFIQLDLQVVKVAAIMSLADVMCEYKIEEVAQWVFPEIVDDHKDTMFKMLENSLEAQSEESGVVEYGYHILRIMYTKSLFWPTMLGKLFEMMLKNEELEDLLRSFLTGYVKWGESFARLHIVCAFLWLVKNTQQEDGRSRCRVQITDVVEFVVKLIEKEKRKTIHKTGDGAEHVGVLEADPQDGDMNAIFVLSWGILREMRKQPDGLATRGLVYSLSAIKLDELSASQLYNVKESARKVVQIMEMEGVKTLISHIKRFIKAVEKVLQHKGLPILDNSITGKNRRRQWKEEVVDEVAEVVRTPSEKRRRLVREEGEGWAREVKEEVLSQSDLPSYNPVAKRHLSLDKILLTTEDIKKEIEEPSKEPREEFQIDSDDSDDCVIQLPLPQKRQSFKRPAGRKSQSSVVMKKRAVDGSTQSNSFLPVFGGGRLQTQTQKSQVDLTQSQQAKRKNTQNLLSQVVEVMDTTIPSERSSTNERHHSRSRRFSKSGEMSSSSGSAIMSEDLFD